ncbi:protein neprosin-like [Silene latifolia]|uniref:protein neprosin-like n=1 Tax=Silene latifolia TaxID=37657 RepID=UPI003D774E8B
MEAHPSTLMILMTAISVLIQGFVATNIDDKHLSWERRLEIINKPATKSFMTEYGDILDCVDIKKQYAFDHPLLKNHSIQMRPSGFIGRRSSLKAVSHVLPKHMRCPQGTVPIKRIQKEDLLMEKMLQRPTLFLASNVSYNDGNREVAGIGAFNTNMGASGSINVWNPQVGAGQYSAACIYTAKEDNSVTNAIQTGWMVSPVVYPNNTETRLYAYWTKDSGKTTGCFNILCPGFVQVSKKTYLGQVISPVSKRIDKQYFIDLEISQDMRTKNWWLKFFGEPVGYWPPSLFTTLAGGAARVGWGGEIYSPGIGTSPEMGSGYLGEDHSYLQVCLMKDLKMLAPQLFPQRQDIKYFMTNPASYSVAYNYNYEWKNYIFFGGPKKPTS